MVGTSVLQADASIAFGMSVNQDISWSWCGTRHRIVIISVLLCALLLSAAGMPAHADAASWRWAHSSLTFTQRTELIPETLAQAPTHVMTRAQFVQSLVRLDQYRHTTTGSPLVMATVSHGARLTDVGRDSIYAKAVQLGWIPSVNGAFVGSRMITADDASLGVMSVLGKRPSMRVFASRIKAEIPGAGGGLIYKAAQVYARTLGMRYNHLVGTERFEVGPKEGMRVAHVAYMLRAAATVSAGRLASFDTHESFAIPTLGANQRTVIATGVHLIGQPYVWGGETEGSQAEGHAGFDCSGFVWRTVIASGVPATDRAVVTSRTSMGMSDIPKKQRITATHLHPGDVMFFGSHGSTSTPAENFHAALWLGNGWFMHSSGSNDGVTISRFEGYWKSSFSWGRRVLIAA